MREILAQAVAESLWISEAFQVSTDRPFRLASGNFSPIYVNCRALISHPVAMDLIAAAAHALIREEAVAFDYIAGGETAGIPFAAFLASRLNTPMLYVRKSTKEHGLPNLVEGNLQPGSRVLLMEDLVTDGRSKLGFIQALRSAGATIEHCVVVFDREQGGTALLAGSSVNLLAITTLALALEAGDRRRMLSAAQLAEIHTYLASPERWHAEKALSYSP